MLEHQNLD